MAENTTEQVNIFIPCCMDMFNPGSAESLIALLKQIGVKANYIDAQTCCGRRFYLEGDINSAKNLGLKLWGELQVRDIPTATPHITDSPLVIPTAACAGFIKYCYPQILKMSAMPLEMKKFSSNVFEICDYIVNVKHITKLNNCFNHRVFYFKSCSARNLYHLGDEPEILLRSTKGLDLLTDDNLTCCCGANGDFAFSNPEVSNEMVKQVVDNIYAKGAEYVTSTDLHCLQQIDAYIQSKGIGLEVMHIVDILSAQEGNEVI
ncbi:MAG: (Fe-S)-binding protein [Bacteroidales bacterium]|nr:(Fe-S)-binding protein [Bacteroidales bacterium]